MVLCEYWQRMMKSAIHTMNEKSISNREMKKTLFYRRLDRGKTSVSRSQE